MAALKSVVAAALVTVLGAACTHPAPRTAQHRAPPGDDIMLYRDVAVIRQRVTLQPPATPTTIEVELATGVAADQITLLDRGGVTITGIHAKTHPPDDVDVEEEEPFVDPDRPQSTDAPGAGSGAEPPARVASLITGIITERGVFMPSELAAIFD